MTPNEICREIVTRLQLGGGLPGSHDRQLDARYWEVRTATGWRRDFSDLNQVAEAIRASKALRWAVLYQGAAIWGGVCGAPGIESKAEGATEAEALTRALLEYLRANRIGQEHLQTCVQEEPWIDVSESVSTANLPKKEDHGRRCELEASDGTKGFGRWNAEYFGWNWGPKAIDDDVCRPAAVGEDISRWRYAK